MPSTISVQTKPHGYVGILTQAAHFFKTIDFSFYFFVRSSTDNNLSSQMRQFTSGFQHHVEPLLLRVWPGALPERVVQLSTQDDVMRCLLLFFFAACRHGGLHGLFSASSIADASACIVLCSLSEPDQLMVS